MQQNKEMEMMQQQKAGHQAPMQKPPQVPSLAPQANLQSQSHLRSSITMEQPGDAANQGGNTRRQTLSENRRNHANSNFRAAGEQAILRNSSTNNRQEAPTNANMPV